MSWKEKRLKSAIASKIANEIPPTNVPFDLHYNADPNSPTIDFLNNPVTGSEIMLAVKELQSKYSEDLIIKKVVYFDRVYLECNSIDP